MCDLTKTLEVDNEEFYKVLDILTLKSKSIENLFFSYMNDHFDFFSKSKLEEIIDLYADITLQKNYLIRTMLNDCLSEDEVLLYTSDKYCIQYNCDKKEVYIFLKNYEK